MEKHSEEKRYKNVAMEKHSEEKWYRNVEVKMYESYFNQKIKEFDDNI